MTEGEQLVWAAAYVKRLGEILEGPYQFALNQASDYQAKRIASKLCVDATEFADLAVGSMRRARKQLVRKKMTKTSQYTRLVEMLK